MADPQLVDFIRKHIKTYGPEPLKEQLLSDGLSPEEVDAAIAEAAAAPPPRPKSRLAMYVAGGGAGLLLLAGYLGSRKAPPPQAPSVGTIETMASGDRIFRGHYGYILKLPPGYEAHRTFTDPQKTREVVYIYPKGTDHTHFIHEGLYGHLGIIRLEVSPRRVPQGIIGIDTLRAWVKARLGADKANFTMRDQVTHGMSGFVVNVTEPFASAKAYLVGQKVYYTLSGGSEDTLFTGLISSLIEVAPTDAPGK